jgi:hypothetical protein
MGDPDDVAIDWPEDDVSSSDVGRAMRAFAALLADTALEITAGKPEPQEQDPHAA